jgi:hypothetical protein
MYVYVCACALMPTCTIDLMKDLVATSTVHEKYGSPADDRRWRSIYEMNWLHDARTTTP